MSRIIRVLQVSSYGLGHAGGLELVAEMLSTHLARWNCLTTWAFGTTRRPRPNGYQEEYSVVDPFERLIGVPMPIPTPSACGELFHQIRRCDVVLVHDFMYFSSAFTMLCCVLWRKPFVLVVHVWRVQYSNPVLNWLQSVAHLTFGSLALGQAAAVVTINRENLRRIETRRTGPTHFVPNGVAATTPSPSQDAESNLNGRIRPGFVRRVCFAGRLVEKKGLQVVREAAAAFPEVEFVIAGTGPIDPRSWSLPNVTALGWVSRAVLFELFKMSDLLLLPSRGEGFPLSVQEAMVAGLPCAIFEETWEAWGRDRDQFRVLSDVDYLADLRDILGSPLLAETRREIANYAMTTWDWERTARVYSEILHRPFDGTAMSAPAVVASGATG